MCDYTDSTQLREWLFSPELLEQCRKRANYKARQYLACSTNTSLSGSGEEQRATAAADVVMDGADSTSVQQPHAASSSATTAAAAAAATADVKVLLPVHCFAAGYVTQHSADEIIDKDDVWTSTPKRGSQPLLSSDEEQLLIQFYSGKINYLIGPKADIPRCRRDIKVTATAALLFRRFYLSNSIMIHDPKAIMVSAAFLASKVEDATADVRALEEATKHMQAHVAIEEIVTSELYLLDGLHSDLMCFHPHKTLIGYSEDLRTYLRSKDGRSAIVFSSSNNNSNLMVSGEDLRPIHDEARRIVDDACVSDIPLLYTPGQIGLAAMILANEELEKSREQQQQHKQQEIEQLVSNGDEEKKTSENKTVYSIKIDLQRYLADRFKQGRTETEQQALQAKIANLTEMLSQLKNGKYGCGNYDELDMSALKAVHKKLKKCKAWGDPGETQQKSEKKKKTKKRKVEGDTAAPAEIS